MKFVRIGNYFINLSNVTDAVIQSPEKEEGCRYVTIFSGGVHFLTLRGDEAEEAIRIFDGLRENAD